MAYSLSYSGFPAQNGFPRVKKISLGFPGGTPHIGAAAARGEVRFAGKPQNLAENAFWVFFARKRWFPAPVRLELLGNHGKPQGNHWQTTRQTRQSNDGFPVVSRWFPVVSHPKMAVFWSNPCHCCLDVRSWFPVVPWWFPSGFLVVSLVPCSLCSPDRAKKRMRM